MNRQRWLRTRRRLDNRRGARFAEMFMSDVSKRAEREFFFGERGPEQFAAPSFGGFAVAPVVRPNPFGIVHPSECVRP